MPDEKKKSKSNASTDFLFFLLIAAAVLSMFGTVFSGGAISSFISGFVPSNSLSSVYSPVGGSTSTSKPTQVFDVPGRNVIGAQPEGAVGTVLRGPIVAGTERYWFVDFEAGADGWVPESVLLGSDGTAFYPGNTPIGTRISTPGTTAGATIYAEPGGPQTGTSGPGAKGIVTEGPRFAGGERYWHVNFDNGQQGWVKESELLSENGTAFNRGGSPIGNRVFVAANSGASVYEVPGGLRIGTQALNNQGYLADGPVSINGHRFWFVEFDSGTSGWVDENDINFVYRVTPVSKATSLLVIALKALATLLSLLFLSGAIYALIRTSQIIAERNRRIHALENPEGAAAVQKEFVNRRWERVLVHIQSDNPADWRLAVLESDIMLAELLDKMGYIGENVGEKLKRIEKSDFNTIDDAWEAHKVRNVIAHQGSDFVLSRREAQRVIGLYANVFREFRYIGAQEMPPKPENS